MKKHNFSAGPAILPDSVFDQAAAAVRDFNGSGLSILEISHRSAAFVEVLDKAVALVRELYQLSDEYEVLFLTGGASSQFFMTAMNLLASDAKAAYVDTGSWSTKAIKEAKLFGAVEVVASSKDQNYNYIPKGYSIPSDASYLHLTSNNTIFGTQYHEWPDTTLPLVSDMSSDIFSRHLPIDRFGLIYAGAQKNMGPAGTTLVIVRKDMLGKAERTIPTMLNYETHIAKNSSFNTPPVFPIYVSMLTMEWVIQQGGLAAMETKNKEKAELLYQAIDSNPLFKGTTAPEDRSLMNVTFVVEDASLEEAFLKLCAARGIEGIKGHRSVGGFRASIYNAMPLDSVKHLIAVMEEFAQVSA
jgi:phosphoserine aminotransferase